MVYVSCSKQSTEKNYWYLLHYLNFYFFCSYYQPLVQKKIKIVVQPRYHVRQLTTLFFDQLTKQVTKHIKHKLITSSKITVNHQLRRQLHLIFEVFKCLKLLCVQDEIIIFFSKICNHVELFDWESFFFLSFFPFLFAK